MKRLSTVTILLTALALSSPAQSGPFGEAIGGAIGGALIGGLLGGDRGADIGATLGGIRGLSRGVNRERHSRRRAEQEAAHYRRQAEMERYRSSYRSTPTYNTSSSGGTVSEIQRSLLRLGYDPGDIGSMNSRTREAIMRYQADHGLLETGEPSQELLRHMIRNGG
ncbi:MAG: hypothetical protein DHS20C11_01330 [Lysobacteraceae bacterium]|nr:MAG: hypothetical protein DHS20C11_01330 [Xanthomonadaceae bacterium]